MDVQGFYNVEQGGIIGCSSQCEAAHTHICSHGLLDGDATSSVVGTRTNTTSFAASVNLF